MTTWNTVAIPLIDEMFWTLESSRVNADLPLIHMMDIEQTSCELHKRKLGSLHSRKSPLDLHYLSCSFLAQYIVQSVATEYIKTPLQRKRQSPKFKDLENQLFSQKNCKIYKKIIMPILIIFLMASGRNCTITC